MKYIEMLPDVMLTTMVGQPIIGDSEEQVTVSMREFLLGRLTDPKFATGMDTIMKAVALRDMIKDVEVGGYVVIDDDHWELLVDVIKNPSQQTAYNPMFAHCFLEFMKAVTEGSSSDPREQKKTEEAN
jgi:hypothetical protein